MTDSFVTVLRRGLLALIGLASTAAHADLVGSTAGAFSVSKGGSASYSVPITVPPGGGGLTPKLSIDYDSGGGSGPAGYGFSVSGLSQITRCPPTWDQDGVLPDPVDFDSSDKFCLDGQRLIAVQGAYGEIGTEYRTETESFSKVVSVGGLANDPGSFTVKTKSGLIYEYGTTPDSRFEPPGSGGSALTWGVKTIRDTLGNYMTVSYQENTSTGEFYPNSVSYAGNTPSGIAPYNSISFEWIARATPSVGYVGGARVEQSKIISKIKTYSGFNLVREYQLTYTTSVSTGHSLLSSVRECAANSQCFPATNFTWTGTSSANPNFDGTGSGTWQGHAAGLANTSYADIDGDGAADIIGREGADTASWKWVACLSRVNNFTCTDIPGNNEYIDASLTGDYNGDGLTDLAILETEAGEPLTIQPRFMVIVRYSAGEGFAGGKLWHTVNGATLMSLGIGGTRTGDFNGDGKADIFAISKSSSAGSSKMRVVMYENDSGTAVRQFYGATTSSTWGRPFEFDGDGRTDFITSTGTQSQVCTAANGYVCENWGGAAVNAGESAVYGDFNGDGLIDFAAHASGANWNICNSTGKAFSCTVQVLSTAITTNAVDGDFNGDGLTDLAARTVSTNWLVCLNKSGSFSCGVRSSSDYATTDTRAIDLNGDGLSDLVGNSSNSNNWSVKLASEPKPDLLQRAVSGLGATVDIAYKRLSDRLYYQRPADFTYPVRGLAAPMYVVSSSDLANGIGGQRRVIYTYEGARVHVRGRGYLSFSKQIVFDETSRLREISEFRQDFPFIGMPSSSRTETESGQVISLEEMTYDKKLFGTGLSTRYFPFAARSISYRYEIPPFAKLVTTTIADYTYGDDYGNATTVVNTVYEGAVTSGLAYTTTTISQFTNDTANWMLGRLSQSQVTRQNPFQPAKTRTSAFEYSASTGLLSAEIIEPGTALELRTEYLRDTIGNITDTTVSGANVLSRTKRDEFNLSSPYYGRFNTRTLNALGHSETRTFDPATGNVLSVTDANGLITNFQYDELSRKTGETFNQHGISKSMQMDRLWCSQTTYCAGTTGVLVIRNTDSAGAETYAVLDVLEREVRKVAKSPGGGYVEVITEHDSQGRVLRKSSPRFRTSSYTHWTNYVYDVIGRVLEERAPLDQNTPDGRITRLEYDGLTTRQYDALNRMTVRQTDPLEKTVRVTDALNGEIVSVYDSFENLISTTDAGGAVTTLVYDIRGRKVSMTDPNMGQWSYEYNTLGELIRQTDAKNQQVEMLYDLLGRLRERTEPEGITTWTYDTLWKGALTEVNSPDYRRAYAYNLFGGVQTETTSIASTEPPPGVLTLDSFTASPDAFSEGYSTVLSWASSEATACSASGTLPGWSGAKSTNGNQTIRVTVAGTYSALLNCTGGGGQSANRSLSITVNVSPAVLLNSFTANPSPVDEDKPTTLAWDSSNAISCMGSGSLPGWAGNKVLDGSQTITVADSGEYQATLTCRDILDRTASQTISITVNLCLSPLLSCIAPLPPVPAPPATSSSASSTNIDQMVSGPLCALGIGSACGNSGDPALPLVLRHLDEASTIVSGQVPQIFGFQPSSSMSTGDFVEYVQAYDYDSLARVTQITYPSGFKVAHSYNSAGALDKVYDPAAPATPYWQAQGWDEWGHSNLTLLRNGVETLRSYDQAVGRLDSIMSGPLGTSAVQSLDYNWDAVGNLISRLDNNQGGLRESFEYDTLNRVTRSTLSGIAELPGTFENLAVSYAASGNILSKSGVGNYSYGAKPHVVTSAGSNSYGYDANGNQTTGAGRSYTLASHNLPTRIDMGGGTSSEFLYGPERQRIRQTSLKDGKGSLIYYAGALYEEHRRGSTVDKKHSINTPEGVVAIETWFSSGAVRRDYLHRDHLSSVDVITNDAGDVSERLSFDAFGKRRGVNWQGNPSNAASLTARGYTSHEQLDNVGLIHMNGRVYDPTLGRFISADSFIQAPLNTQSYNRYSYVMNNPLSLVDPSGFSWLSSTFKKIGNWVKNNWRTLAAIAITIVVPWAAPAAWGAWGAVAGGFAAGLVASGGDLKTALISAATAGLFYGVGSYYKGVAEASGGLSAGQAIAKVAAHGFVGGISSVAQGGKFSQGFLSAGATQALSTPIDNLDRATIRVAAAAVVGGTAAELGGGKFANGAVTGAFSRAFNDELDRHEKPVWPTDHQEIKSGFSTSRTDPVTGGSVRPHSAIDIVNPNGGPAYSILDGNVSETGFDAEAGNYIKIDHGGGLETSYSHTGSSLTVGASVVRGQIIGYSNSSGVITGPHLHFVTRVNGARVNPCTVVSCP